MKDGASKDGHCEIITDPPCDDGQACTAGDTCDASGVCLSGPVIECAPSGECLEATYDFELGACVEAVQAANQPGRSASLAAALGTIAARRRGDTRPGRW